MQTSASEPPFGASTPEEEAALETSVRAFLAKNSGATPLHALPIPAARAAFAALQAEALTAPAPALVEDHVLPVGPTGAVPIRILRPVEATVLPLPPTLYLHGGGWVLGDRQTHDRVMRALCTGARTAIVYVDYTLAPEACFPVQNEQAYAVLDFLATHGESMRLDCSRMAVAGDDAAGALAATVTLMAKQRRGPDIAFQLLLCPILGEPPLDAPDAPWLTKLGLRRSLDAAFPEPASRRLATAFPLLASAQQLNDLPPALIITAEFDLCRDGGETFARRLRAAGVSASATRYEGTIHDFLVLNALAASPAALGATAQASAALHSALYEA
jgi:acetyl esterase